MVDLPEGSLRSLEQLAGNRSQESLKGRSSVSPSVATEKATWPRSRGTTEFSGYSFHHKRPSSSVSVKKASGCSRRRSGGGVPSYRFKLAYAVCLAIEEICRTTHLPDRSFITLTMKDCPTEQEAHRRWRCVIERLRRQFPGVRIVGVWQRQKRGAWHVHFVIDRRLDCVWFRALVVECGFGPQTKHKLIEEKPVHFSFHDATMGARQVARYITRYITQEFGELRPGSRLVTYVGPRPATTSFNWAGGFGRLWRKGREVWDAMFQDRLTDDAVPGWDQYWVVIRLGWESMTVEERGRMLETSDAVAKWWNPANYPF